jgi:hypothetical protein
VADIVGATLKAVRDNAAVQGVDASTIEAIEARHKQELADLEARIMKKLGAKDKEPKKDKPAAD